MVILAAVMLVATRFARLSPVAYERLGKEPPADIKLIAATPMPDPESGSA